MPRPRGKKETVRFSVGVDPATYAELSIIASENDTTVAWVVRRALGEFVSKSREQRQGELPLLGTTGAGSPHRPDRQTGGSA